MFIINQNPLGLNIFSVFKDWNLVLIIIAGCSVLAFAIFIERLITLKKSEKDTESLVIELRKAIKEGNIIEAIKVCEAQGGPVANIIKAGLLKHNYSKENIESAMETAGLVEIARLEKNTRILSIIANIAPLIGLLGTVLGFIHAFAEMRLSGLMDISTTRLGASLEYALITAAAGLVVAIPTTVAYNYIVSQVEAFVLEIQISSSEIVDLLIYSKDNYEI